MPTLTPTAEYTIKDQERMRAANRYFDWQLALAKPWLGKRVLEIGCGMGNFTRTILDRELVVGLDVESDCVKRHRENHTQFNNVVSLLVDASDPSSVEKLQSYKLDSVVSLNVLEHIEDDHQTLRNLWQILPMGGRVVLIIPAFHALYGPIDHLLGHYRRYTKESVMSLARSTGFHPIRLQYLNSVGFFGWWANAKIFKRTEQSDAQIATFDKLIVPWLRPLESVIPPPVGQSVFTVLEKRAPN
jgi:SAM-dependent methyltransferase